MHGVPVRELLVGPGRWTARMWGLFVVPSGVFNEEAQHLCPKHYPPLPPPHLQRCFFLGLWPTLSPLHQKKKRQDSSN